MDNQEHDVQQSPASQGQINHPSSSQTSDVLPVRSNLSQKGRFEDDGCVSVIFFATIISFIIGISNLIQFHTFSPSFFPFPDFQLEPSMFAGIHLSQSLIITLNILLNCLWIGVLALLWWASAKRKWWAWQASRIFLLLLILVFWFEGMSDFLQVLPHLAEHWFEASADSALILALSALLLLAVVLRLKRFRKLRDKIQVASSRWFS
jgi:hypothetical protein